MRNLFILFILLLSPVTFACYDGAGSGRCGWYGTSPYGAGIGYGGSNSGSYSDSYSIPKQVPIRIPSKYGAIAMNDRAFATSYNAKSERAAKKEALSKCNKNEKVKCKVYFTVRNGCFSGAFGHYDNGLGKAFFDSSANRGESENAVLKKCYNYDEYKFKKCTIFIPEQCSLPG